MRFLKPFILPLAILQITICNAFGFEIISKAQHLLNTEEIKIMQSKVTRNELLCLELMKSKMELKANSNDVVAIYGVQSYSTGIIINLKEEIELKVNL